MAHKPKLDICHLRNLWEHILNMFYFILFLVFWSLYADDSKLIWKFAWHSNTTHPKHLLLEYIIFKCSMLNWSWYPTSWTKPYKSPWTMPNVFWRAQTLSVNPNSRWRFHLVYPQEPLHKKTPTIASTLFMTAMWDFSFSEDVMGFDPQLPSCRPNAFYNLNRIQGFSRAMA